MAAPTPIADSVKDHTPQQLLDLVKTIYGGLLETVKAGTASQADIRACNFARREIEECRRAGFGE